MVSLQKPLRGTALLERRGRRAARVAEEQKAMRAAKKRDSGKCRVPRCSYKHLPIDACHLRHRGAGGNPDGSRTTQATVIALCRVHHGLYDAGELRIEPLTAQDFDGACEFYGRHPETGQFIHLGTESRIGVSTTRSQR